MKRARNQHGFAVVELLLVAIIILAVAGIGYWVYQQRTKTTESSIETTSQLTSEDQAIQKVSNDSMSSEDNEDKTLTTASNSEASQAENATDSALQAGEN